MANSCCGDECLFFKAESVASSIMTRESNSPLAENLSLISSACSQALTWHGEKRKQEGDLPENTQCAMSRALEGETSLPRLCPLYKRGPGSSFHTRYQVFGTYIVMQRHAFWVWLFSESLWNTVTLAVSASRLLHRAADSFPFYGLCTSSEVTLYVYIAFHPHMTPSSSHDWEHLRYDSDMPDTNSQKLY